MQKVASQLFYAHVQISAPCSLQSIRPFCQQNNYRMSAKSVVLCPFHLNISYMDTYVVNIDFTT